MDTAQQQAAPRCLVFLHPAAAGNPRVIREIHAATGLMAVASNAGRTVSLIQPTQPDGPSGGGAAA